MCLRRPLDSLRTRTERSLSGVSTVCFNELPGLSWQPLLQSGRWILEFVSVAAQERLLVLYSTSLISAQGSLEFLKQRQK